jgi:hypothetical protein
MLGAFLASPAHLHRFQGRGWPYAESANVIFLSACLACPSVSYKTKT